MHARKRARAHTDTTRTRARLAQVERSADVVSLGATGDVRCSPGGAPLGRRADPTELLRLTRADFEEVERERERVGGRGREAGME